MLGKYDINPVKEFTDSLYTEISNYNNNYYCNYYSKIDSILKLILLNNGCKLKDDAVQNIITLKNSLILCFIVGGQGNDYNKIYDVVEFNGATYFVIFLDEFKDIITDKDNQSEITTDIDNLFGKSLYFMNIRKLTELYLSLTINPIINTPQFTNTCIGYNLKIMPLIVAAYLIKSICGELTEVDIEGCGLAIETLEEYINHYTLSLYGIRNKE